MRYKTVKVVMRLPHCRQTRVCTVSELVVAKTAFGELPKILDVKLIKEK